jgi:hypothetical protein
MTTPSRTAPLTTLLPARDTVATPHHPQHTLPRLAAPCLALLLLLLGPAVTRATTRQTPATPPPASSPALLAPPAPAGPTAADALAALRLARATINLWATPIAAEQADPATLLQAQGVAIVLRFDGQIVGRAALLAPPGKFIRVIDAIAEAQAEAARRLAPRLESIPAAKHTEGLAALARSMTISVELAGPLTFITADDAEGVEDQVPWMLHGVAARLIDRLAPVYPTAMMHANIGPATALQQAASTLTGRAELALLTPEQLRREHEIILYRFPVIHAAEPSPEAPPEILYRGQRLIDRTAIDSITELATFADTLADALARSILHPDAPLADHPLARTAIDAPAATADPIVSAMALVALDRYLALRPSTPAPPASVLAQARKARDAVEQRALSTAATSPPAAALVALTLRRAGTPLPPPISRAVLDALAPDTTGPDIFSPELPPGSHALLAWAQPDPARRADALRAAFIPPGGLTSAPAVNARLTSQMPWIVMAELDTHTTAPDAPIPSAAALRQVRTAAWDNQLAPHDATGAQQDLIGGLLFPGSRQPLPTWHTARVIAALAPMLADERLTPPPPAPDRAAEIVRLLSAMRFLRQLQVDRTMQWTLADPSTTLGAMRPSVFDQRTSPEATSMTLLATTELLRAIDTLAKPTEQPGK